MGFHPRRKTQLRNVRRLERLRRSSSGCEAQDWRFDADWNPKLVQWANEQRSDAVTDELSQLMYDHSLQLADLQWHVPSGTTLLTKSKRFSIRSRCVRGRLQTLIDFAHRS